MRILLLALAAMALAQSLAADNLEGRWKLLSAEDVRPNGEVVRHPWGDHPVGSIVVQNGWLYLQIMSTDTPAFASDKPMADQTKAKLLSSYIAYSGACTIDAAQGSVTFKVEAAWRPDYVGTDQRRIFHFESGKLIFGTAPNSIRGGTEPLTRRLTLERVQ
ncbi:MAG TPA: lipocalin-like domain-containing protein [Bryobacteraceae bacterium]|nr:lipocalin-like domain-containing protein [Bryobacteraceae bacterium]